MDSPERMLLIFVFVRQNKNDAKVKNLRIVEAKQRIFYKHNTQSSFFQNVFLISRENVSNGVQTSDLNKGTY